MSEGPSPLLERLARLEGQLEKARQQGMDDRESFLRFEALVGEIAALDNPATVPALLRFLDDDLDLDLAFGIIHSVERFDCPTYVPLLLGALPSLQSGSQEWAQTCLLRVLNSAPCFAVLLQLAPRLSSDQVLSLRRTLSGLVQQHPQFAERRTRIETYFLPDRPEVPLARGARRAAPWS